MDLKAVVLVKVTLLVFLVSSTATVDARFDPTTALITGFFGDANLYDVKLSTIVCCDSCTCTRSYPPKCHCGDVGETCHAACKSCMCTRSFPPQCRCVDVNNFCYGRCNCDNSS